MEKYHKETPRPLSRQNLASPPRTALITDILTVYGSRVIHSRILPERSSEPWHKPPSKRVPELVCPAAHSSAYCAFRFYPSTSARLLGKKHTVTTFMCQSVWCLDDRWQEDSGVLVQKEHWLVLVVPRSLRTAIRSLTERLDYMDFSASCHLSWYPFTLWALVRCSPLHFHPTLQPVDRCERDTMRTQNGTALWFIIGESHEVRQPPSV